MAYGKFTKVAATAGIAGALILPATAAHAGDKTERAIIGALLGGIAGAAVSDGDGAGVAIGAAAGAALGAATADNDGRRRYSRSYRTSRPYAHDSRYRYTQARRYDRGYYDRGYAPAYNSYPAYGRGYYDQYGYYRR